MRADVTRRGSIEIKTYARSKRIIRPVACPFCDHECGHKEPRWKHFLDNHDPEDVGLSPTEEPTPELVTDGGPDSEKIDASDLLDEHGQTRDLELHAELKRVLDVLGAPEYLRLDDLQTTRSRSRGSESRRRPQEEHRQRRREENDDPDDGNLDDADETATRDSWRYLDEIPASVVDVAHAHTDGELGDRDIRVRLEGLPDRLR